MLESLFNNAADLFSSSTLGKRDFNKDVFLWNIVEFFRAAKNICERTTASLIWKMAYEYTITLSFSSILRNSTAAFERNSSAKHWALSEKTHIWKIRNFLNEIIDIYFYFQFSVFFIVVNYKPPFTFYFCLINICFENY